AAAIVGLIAQPSVYPDGSGAYLAGLVLLYAISEHSRLLVSVLALASSLLFMFLARRTDGVGLLWLIQAEYSWIVLAWVAGRAPGEMGRLRLGLGPASRDGSTSESGSDGLPPDGHPGSIDGATVSIAPSSLNMFGRLASGAERMTEMPWLIDSLIVLVLAALA